MDSSNSNICGHPSSLYTDYYKDMEFDKTHTSSKLNITFSFEVLTGANTNIASGGISNLVVIIKKVEYFKHLYYTIYLFMIQSPIIYIIYKSNYLFNFIYCSFYFYFFLHLLLFLNSLFIQLYSNLKCVNSFCGSCANDLVCATCVTSTVARSLPDCSCPTLGYYSESGVNEC